MDKSDSLKLKLNTKRKNNELIDDEKNELKKQLSEEKNKNKLLEKENKNLNDIINTLKQEKKNIKTNLHNEIKKLKEKIRQLEKELSNKNDEIKNYILQNQTSKETQNQITQIETEEKNFTVSFEMKNNKSIAGYEMPCKNTDLFVRLEEKLYNEYPKYKNFETFFLVNNRKILRFKTLEENNIINNDKISLIINDK